MKLGRVLLSYQLYRQRWRQPRAALLRKPLACGMHWQRRHSLSSGQQQVDSKLLSVILARWERMKLLGQMKQWHYAPNCRTWPHDCALQRLSGTACAIRPVRPALPRQQQRSRQRVQARRWQLPQLHAMQLRRS